MTEEEFLVDQTSRPGSMGGSGDLTAARPAWLGDADDLAVGTPATGKTNSRSLIAAEQIGLALCEEPSVTPGPQRA